MVLSWNLNFDFWLPFLIRCKRCFSLKYYNLFLKTYYINGDKNGIRRKKEKKEIF